MLLSAIDRTSLPHIPRVRLPIADPTVYLIRW